MHGYEYRDVTADEGRLCRVRFISYTHNSDWHPVSAKDFTALKAASKADFKLVQTPDYLPVRSGYLSMPKGVNGNVLGLPLEAYPTGRNEATQFYHIGQELNDADLVLEDKAL